MSKKNQSPQDKQFGTLTAVPDGFTTRLGPNNQEFVVPQYLLPALDHAFISFRKKGDLEALNAKPEVNHSAMGSKAFAAPRHCRACLSVPAVPCHVSANLSIHCFPGLSFLWQTGQVKNQPYSLIGGKLMYPADPVRTLSSG
jgi:hypothetical protein